MFWYWFGFSAFLVLIISGFFGLKMFNINMPKSLCVRYLIFSAFIDAFYISIVYSHLLWQFIFGGLCLLTIFMNLSINFVNSDKSQPIKRFDLLFDFLCGIGLTIYLLYIIPNEALQSIMIPVVSAVYGGLLTLIGVAWTIKNQDKQRKNDEKLKFKPIFVIEGYSSEQNVWSKSNTRMVQFNSDHKKKEDNNEYFTLDNIILSNSDNSNLFIKNIYINNEPLSKKFDKFLVYKGEIIEILLNGDYSYDNINMTIEITDMLENEYRYNIIYGENKEYLRHKKNEITEIYYTRFIEKVEEIKRG